MCFAFSSVKTYKAKKLAIVFKQEIILRGVMIFTFQPWAVWSRILI